MVDLLNRFNAKALDLLNKVTKKEQRDALVDSLNAQMIELSHHTDDSSNKEVDMELPSGWGKEDVSAPISLLDFLNWQRLFNNSHFGNYPRDTQVIECGKNTHPMKFLMLPDWVRTFPGFTPTAWIVSEGVKGTRAELVTYEKSEPSDGGEPPFAMIMFTKNGVPFKQMDNMCKVVFTTMEKGIAEYGAMVAKNYDMSRDGKIRNLDGDGLPNKKMTMAAINDFAFFYSRWRNFPDTEDYKEVEILSEALEKVSSMKDEDDNQRIRKQIERLRDQIHTCQESISKLEKDENRLYEEAADALNLLEKHGYGMENVNEMVSSALEKRTPTFGNYTLAP